ncbi:hypothetical protein D9M71_610520 [compost metagenome]
MERITEAYVVTVQLLEPVQIAAVQRCKFAGETSQEISHVVSPLQAGMEFPLPLFLVQVIVVCIVI